MRLQDQILGEDTYADSQKYDLYDDHILSLCHTAALKAWDRIQESGKRMEPYTRVKQGQREPFSDFFFTSI